MKRSIIVMLATIPLVLDAAVAVAPYIQPRSQSVDSSRELVGWTHFINLFDPERVYGATAFTLEYTQSFRPNDIMQTMFGPLLQCTSSDGTFIGISGSQYGSRNEKDLLADYFGLPVDFKSVVKFTPSIRNIILDFDFYLGLDEWLCGLYFRIHAPVVHTWWNLNFCEKVTSGGTIGYAPGYFSSDTTTIGTGSLLHSFKDYVYEQLAPNIGENDIFESLKFARMSPQHLQLTRLSDLEAAMGWNFVQSDEYHFGFNIRMTAPCGNRPKGQYLFEPIIGNGHHWGLGGGLTAHWRLWTDETADNSLGFYADANIGTLFKAHQRRTFDLVNRPLSRYMLAELLGSPVVNLFANPDPATAASSVAPIGQFQGVFRPVANLTTIEVNSSFGVQADITLLLNYTHRNFGFDIGYNYWNITCEKLQTTCCINPLNDNTNWTLKGDAYVYGFAATDSTVLPGQAIALSATENTATITSGTNTPFGTPFDPSQMANPKIDNPQYAVVDTSANTNLIMVSPGTASGGIQQRTSKDPIYLSSSDINLDGARTNGASQKVFFHFSYSWNEHCGWTPYVGVGGKAEFASKHTTDCCADSCNGCLDTNVSEWGIWAKGGFAF